MDLIVYIHAICVCICSYREISEANTDNISHMIRFLEIIMVFVVFNNLVIDIQIVFAWTGFFYKDLQSIAEYLKCKSDWVHSIGLMEKEYP